MELSVIIPTYRRPDALRQCLEHLASQTLAPSFEAIVSIDAGDDAPAGDSPEPGHDLPYPIRVTRSPGHGHAVTVNQALRIARGRIVLIIGDDIYAQPDLLRRHAERHRALDDERTAVQGRVSWHPSLLPDRFLEWEARRGIQFAFPSMKPHSYVPLNCLYTCNVSFRREWLLSLGGFDESLPIWIDTVFAHRARQHGLRVYYDPDACGLHDDRWTLERVCRRRFQKGAIAARLIASDPAFASHVTIPRLSPWRSVRHALSRLVRPLAERSDWEALVGWCWIHEIQYQFARGLAAGAREQSSPPR